MGRVPRCPQWCRKDDPHQSARRCTWEYAWFTWQMTVAGESASFRNLRVREGQPNASWKTTKAKLLAAKTAGK